MKKIITLFIMAALSMQVEAKEVQVEATSADCIFCTKSPAKRYAKTHKRKEFKGYKKMKFTKSQLAGITYDKPKGKGKKK